MVGFQEIILEPGQFIFGRNAASKELRMSVQTIRTNLDSLRKRQNLTIKSTNKFSIITITNWDTYQHKENETNQQTNHELTSNPPATNHKQEHKNKEEIPYAEIIDYLNLKTGKKFSSTTEATKKHIASRLNEGRTVQDFKTVIDNKTDSWLNDPKWFKFLRPETLFGTHFESYLNEKTIQNKKQEAWEAAY
jgi:uncharacterized phage protein (TIGR02220 family)